MTSAQANRECICLTPKLCVLGGNTRRIFDSRPTFQGGMMRRRRLCCECGLRITTYELSTQLLARTARDWQERIVMEERFGDGDGI